MNSKWKKKEISDNSLFREYKKNETNVNLLIMGINHKLKELEENKKECK